MPATRVWCMRHAEAANSAAGVQALAELTDAGRVQAAAARGTLTGEDVTRIYCSTLTRARQTAEILAAPRRIPLSFEPGLTEVAIGDAEGSVDPDSRATVIEVLREWIVESHLGARVRDGESGEAVLARVTGVFDRIAADHPGQTVAAVGHTGSLTLALSRLTGLGHRVWGHPLPFAYPILVEWDGTSWTCRSWPGLPEIGPLGRA